jgi:16S rRNA (guanine527-N7)-methyltransferase
VTEADAREWLEARVPRETIERLERLVAIVREENANQNLIASSTLDTIWSRHIVDSAQLLALAPTTGKWIDLGSGAGFPGLVIGLLGRHNVVLAESRVKRATFLQAAVKQLRLADRVSVAAGRIEMLPADQFDIVSARAYAPLEKLFASSEHLASLETRWVLPKGRGAQAELDAARRSWQGDFRIVPSVTDPEAAIIVAKHVRSIDERRRAGSAR